VKFLPHALIICVCLLTLFWAAGYIPAVTVARGTVAALAGFVLYAVVELLLVKRP
jgi:hypothetical protein